MSELRSGAYFAYTQSLYLPSSHMGASAWLCGDARPRFRGCVRPTTAKPMALLGHNKCLKPWYLMFTVPILPILVGLVSIAVFF